LEYVSYTYDYLSDKINNIVFLGFDTDKTPMVNKNSQKVQLSLRLNKNLIKKPIKEAK